MSSGVYRFTRNPIYVSFLIVVIAAAIGANSWWVLASLVPLFILFEFGVIRPEEKYLSSKFGATYDDYRRHVRRCGQKCGAQSLRQGRAHSRQ